MLYRDSLLVCPHGQAVDPSSCVSLAPGVPGTWREQPRGGVRYVCVCARAISRPFENIPLTL